MKLKIVHQNQENRGDENVTTTTEEPQIPEDDSTKEESPVPAMLLSGKRKRTPKKMIDYVSPIIRRMKKKKKSSSSNSEYGTPDRGGASMSKGDAIVGGTVAPLRLRSPTLLRAEEFRMSLSNDLPSVSKVLVRSHVGCCFWMGLPVPFCKMHLPSWDTEVVLEDESGEEFQIKYIAHKSGLSAGWRKFVAANKLVEGDVLVFQLVEPCRFKVYVIRTNDLTDVDGALSLLILDSQTTQNDSDGAIDAQNKKTSPKSLPLTVFQKKKDNEGPLRLHLGHSDEHSGNDSDEVASEVLEGTKFNGSSLLFKDVKSFEEFRIMANGTCLDSELSDDIRRTYYDLCRSRNAYLHDRLPPGLSSKLAAGMIAETITVTEFIRGCKLTTPRNDIEVMDQSLRSFELLGLNVGFLRARLRKLLSMAYDSESGMDVRRYLEACKGKSRTDDEICELEAKSVELKELSDEYAADVENLRGWAESYKVMFQEEVDKPW